MRTDSFHLVTIYFGENFYTDQTAIFMFPHLPQFGSSDDEERQVFWRLLLKQLVVLDDV